MKIGLKSEGVQSLRLKLIHFHLFSPFIKYVLLLAQAIETETHELIFHSRSSLMLFELVAPTYKKLFLCQIQLELLQ